MTHAAAVLAVDDNATIRKAISMRLGAKGFDVVTAADGEKALELLDRRNFDLVLLDLQMPKMCGDEVLRRLRNRFTSTQLPVIILAASNDKRDINRSLALGANDYVTKPGDLPVLVARINTQLALRDASARAEPKNASASNVVPLAGTGSEIATRDAQKTDEDSVGLEFEALYDDTPMTCFTLNVDGEILLANRFGAEFLGYQRDDLLGRSIVELYAPDDRRLAQEYLAITVELPQRVHHWDIRQLKNNGDILWMRNTARSLQRAGSRMILMTCEDIDATYKLAEELTHQAAHDELTGLANRKTFEKRLTQVIDSAHSERTEHSLAILDLDQLKVINDACGYTAGDEVLRQIARLLKSSVRKRDTLARIGGDQFAVLIEDCPLESARTAAESLRRAIEVYPFEWENRRQKLSASVGIVPINEVCDTVGEALSMADAACCAAKDSGRNRIHTYEADAAPRAAHRGAMLWAGRLHQALMENRFELHLQRIVPLQASARPSSHGELLVRMRDELGNVIMPSEFLPAAERYNLAAQIDQWVLETAFAWLSAQTADAQDIDLCGINLSGQSIGNTDILDFILSQFDAGIVPAAKICFEVTETAAIADLMHAKRFMQQLKDRGCRFALDDFGSGFSSLAYLKHLPVDFLKIDGAFIRDMVSDSIDCAMVRSINDIGHVMGKQTIAEFVEDRATLEMLRSLGVDYAQGFAVNRPVPLAQFAG